VALPAESAVAQVGIHTTTPVNKQYEFESCTLAKSSTLVKSSGIRGSYARNMNRARKQLERVSGQLVLQPSVAEIDLLLPWIMRGTTNTNVTSFTDTVLAANTDRFVVVDKVSKVMTYDMVKVSRATIEATRGEPIKWTLDLEGKSETVANAGTFPSLECDYQNFFVMSDMALTINSVVCEPESVRLIIDHVLETERFLNSLTRANIPSKDRLITLEVTLPYDTVHLGLYDLAVGGAAGTLEFDDGTTSYTFALTNAKTAAQPIEVPQRDEIKLITTFELFADEENDDFEFNVTKATA
jgi:hypothetical protein